MMFTRLYRKFPHLRQWQMPWKSLRILALICAIAVTAVMLVRWGKSYKLDATAWASWVQAFGSIGAIMGAWHIGRTQSQTAYLHARTLRHEERAQRIRALFPIAARASELVEELASEPQDDYFKTKYSEAAFRRCLRAMEEIPLHELGYYGLVDGYMQMQDALEGAAHAAAMIAKLGYGRHQERFDNRASDRHIDEFNQSAIAALSLIRDNQPARY